MSHPRATTSSQTSLDGFLFLTTTSPSRYHLLPMTLAAVMTSVSGAIFNIQHYGEVPECSPFPYLKLLAEFTGNALIVKAVPADMSVAHTKRNVDPLIEFDFFINLDDDLLVPRHAWYRLKQCVHRAKTHRVATLGVVDANDSRGYADYTTEIFPSMFAYLRTPGMEMDKAKHHRFEQVAYHHKYPAITQLYCLPKALWKAPELWDDILEKFKVKGVRGYDVRLEELLNENKIEITLVTGCEAIHMGMEHAFIGGSWTGDHYAK